jgi:hypothetical protein
MMLLLARYRQLAPLLVLTQGAEGCTVFMADEVATYLPDCPR